MTARSTIQDFLAQKRLAMIGVSREPRNFTRMLFRSLREYGYDVVPVNPQVNEIEGTPAYARIQDVTPPVDAALLVTSPSASEQVVRDCAEAGVKRIWLYRAVGTGAVSPAAVDFCHRGGMAVVEGECPYMFLPQAPWPHKMHGWVRRILGAYPA
jgi:predicted CoA-binding protein